MGEEESTTNIMYLQDEIHRLSLADPDAFWSRQAAQLHWHVPPRAAIQISTATAAVEHGRVAGTYPSWSWFPGGEISTCYNCLDRHVLAGGGGGGGRAAILYDSPVTDTKRTITYAELLDEVKVLAGVLREEGVGRGDVVMIYMPMIPAAVAAMLAVNRLGAVHAVVFGGFAAPALAQRIDACRPVAILTASAGIEGARPPVPYRPLVRGALALASHQPGRVLVWERGRDRPATAASARLGAVSWLVGEARGERGWQRLVASARARGVRAERCVPVRSDEPAYILHTSGTTGRPKGVVRQSGGHAVALHFSAGYVYGIEGPGDVMFALSDLGWVVGHSYIVYGPLLRGAASVLYEGKPVGTPDASALWRVAAEHAVTAILTAPTVLRAVNREDREGAHLRRIAEAGAGAGLGSLRALFLAGERSEPLLVQQYQTLLERYCGPAVRVIDHWWTTEFGSPVTGRAICASAALAPASASASSSLPPLVPGSAGRPMPGCDLRIVDDDGAELAPGTTGNVVLGLPLAPSAFCSLWEDSTRFWASYLARFRGRWLDTGDGGYVDRDGNVVIMGRTDDVLNVSAHRLSSGAIEQAIVDHPRVAEAYVVPVTDPLKGQLPFGFLVLVGAASATGPVVPPPDLLAEVQGLVRAQVGAIATLGGALVCARAAVPRTRSGKALRRVLRDVLAAARPRREGEGWGNGGDRVMAIKVPDMIEDACAVDEAMKVAREYFRVVGREGPRAKL